MKHKIFGLKSGNCERLGLGVFDGYHLGHQELAKNCSHLLTFWPHPDILLKKNSELAMLTTLRELRFYQKNLLVLRFDQDIARFSALKFLNEIIYKKLQPKVLVVGYDFHFGYQMQGDVNFIKNWAEKFKSEVVKIEPVSFQNQFVKSSLIRKYFSENKFEEAINLLGHSYLIIGKVIQGEGRGRTLGFPTANLKLPDFKLVPNNGVYKGQVLLDNYFYQALIYIGNKPTFRGKFSKNIEVYILNFAGDLYNKQLKVFLEAKGRDEIVFPNQSELIVQIKKDLADCGG
ncbi:MAG: riboflavin biosynthesis protein RibF [Candidatus Margulisiibacteriota bacterium]|jgi:riboflavin kinase/FMN adenylyltransferase